MKTLQELREEKATLVNRGKALVQIAKDESRDLLPDEKTEFDSIFGVENGAAGKLKDIEATSARLEKLEAEEKKLANNAAKKEFDRQEGGTRIEAVGYKGPLEGYASAEDAYYAGQWAAANIIGSPRAASWCRDKGLSVVNAMSEGDNTKGGLLVIPQIESAIISLFETYSAFYEDVEKVPMASSEYRFMAETDDLTATFVSEVPASGVTASDLGFKPFSLNAKPLQAFTQISKDLDADAVYSIANLVSRALSRAFSKKIDQCGFIGDGTSTYGGIAGLKNALAAGSAYTAITGNTAFSTLDDDDFLGMLGKLPDYARPGAKWYISREGYYASMARLLRAAGGNTVMDLGNGPVLQYAGVPVKLTRSTNSTLTAQTSTTGLCYLGDLNMSAKLGIRSGMEIMVYRELYARNRQIGIEGTMRIDAVVHSTGDANNPGAILALKTPGS